jgi:hypothetical protein
MKLGIIGFIDELITEAFHVRIEPFCISRERLGVDIQSMDTRSYSVLLTRGAIGGGGTVRTAYRSGGLLYCRSPPIVLHNNNGAG